MTANAMLFQKGFKRFRPTYGNGEAEAGNEEQEEVGKNALEGHGNHRIILVPKSAESHDYKRGQPTVYGNTPAGVGV